MTVFIQVSDILLCILRIIYFHKNDFVTSIFSKNVYLCIHIYNLMCSYTYMFMAMGTHTHKRERGRGVRESFKVTEEDTCVHAISSILIFSLCPIVQFIFSFFTIKISMYMIHELHWLLYCVYKTL